MSLQDNVSLEIKIAHLSKNLDEMNEKLNILIQQTKTQQELRRNNPSDTLKEPLEPIKRSEWVRNNDQRQEKKAETIASSLSPSPLSRERLTDIYKHYKDKTKWLQSDDAKALNNDELNNIICDSIDFMNKYTQDTLGDGFFFTLKSGANETEMQNEMMILNTRYIKLIEKIEKNEEYENQQLIEGDDRFDKAQEEDAQKYYKNAMKEINKEQRQKALSYLAKLNNKEPNYKFMLQEKLSKMGYPPPSYKHKVIKNPDMVRTSIYINDVEVEHMDQINITKEPARKEAIVMDQILAEYVLNHWDEVLDRYKEHNNLL